MVFTFGRSGARQHVHLRAEGDPFFADFTAFILAFDFAPDLTVLDFEGKARFSLLLDSPGPIAAILFGQRLFPSPFDLRRYFGFAAHQAPLRTSLKSAPKATG